MTFWRATSSRCSSGVALCAMRFGAGSLESPRWRSHLLHRLGRRVVVHLGFGLVPRGPVIAPQSPFGLHRAADLPDLEPP